MKKVLNHLLTDILLFLVVFLTVIIMGRDVLSGNNVYNIVKDDIGEKINNNNIEKSVLKDFINEEDAEGISEYLNEEDFDEEMGNVISSYFKYTSGISEEKPDLEKFEEVIKSAVDKYEKKTGKKVDEKKIDIAISSMDKVLSEATPSKLDNRVKTFMNIIYSDSILSLVIVLILSVLTLIFIVNRSLIAVIKSSAIVTTINTVFIFILSIVINKVNTESVISAKAIKYFVKLSKKTATIFLIISIVLILILIISNTIRKKDKIKYQKKEEKEDNEE